MTRLQLMWRSFHVKQENIYMAIILELLQANMNEVAKDAIKQDADAQTILDIANTGIDASQFFLLLTSIYSTVGGMWGGMSKTYSNRQQAIRERVNQADIEKAINYWSTDKAKKSADEIVRTQNRQVAKIVEKGVAAGLSNKELATAVKNNPYILGHASVISRVNVVEGANRGSYEAGLQSEYLQVKIWHSQGDAKVRDPSGPINFSQYTHQDVDGVAIPIDQPFLGTHGYIMYPGDPDAAFENIVNCRCFMEVLAMLDKNGKPIPKKMPGISVILPSNNIPGSTSSEGGMTVTNPSPSPDITVIRPGEMRRPDTVTF